MRSSVCLALCITIAISYFGVDVSPAAAAESPFIGSWALTIPGGGAGWLGVENANGELKGSILWGGGSVVPVSSVAVDGDSLVVTRINRAGRPNEETETITATIDGDAMTLTTERSNKAGRKWGKAGFTGKRIPALPPAPDLRSAKFGKPIVLFNGKDLSGWKLMNPNVPNGWSVKDGVLVNEAPQEPGKHISYSNLQTEAEFEDFNISLEVRVPKGGNSGIYLRGIYEVQVADTYGRPLDSHHMGGIYSRIKPTRSAERPAGAWQTVNITLLDRHVTVVLNGKKIVDNQPLLGCTGGALWSDEFRPGPIYLQGDHTSVDYRNIMLRPVVKD